MTLKTYQTEIELGNLYKVSVSSPVKGSEQISSNIYIDSGIVNIYSSNSATAPESSSDMVLSDADVSGILSFKIIPTYIYLEQKSGTSTEIVVSGLNVEDLGAI